MCVHVGRYNGDYSFSVFLERPIYLFVRLTYQSRRRINRRRSCRWCDDGDVPIRKQSGLIPIVFTRTHAHSYRQPTLTMVLCMTGVWTPKAAAVEMAIATSRRANRDFIIVFVFNFTERACCCCCCCWFCCWCCCCCCPSLLLVMARLSLRPVLRCCVSHQQMGYAALKHVCGALHDGCLIR